MKFVGQWMKEMPIIGFILNSIKREEVLKQHLNRNRTQLCLQREDLIITMKSPALVSPPTMIDHRITQFNKSKVKQTLALVNPGSPDNQQQRKERLTSLKESRVLEEPEQVHHSTITFRKRRDAPFHTQIACKSLA
jgi:hypothetical protein